MDLLPVDPVSIVRAGSGPPQRGDWFFLHGPLFPVGGTAGATIGVYQCFGAWTRAATETSAPDQRLVTVLWNLVGRGWITGLTHEGGANPNAHVGASKAVRGSSTGRWGRSGRCCWRGSCPGWPPARAVVRGVLDLLLPDAAPAACPAPADDDVAEEGTDARPSARAGPARPALQRRIGLAGGLATAAGSCSRGPPGPRPSS